MLKFIESQVTSDSKPRGLDGAEPAHYPIGTRGNGTDDRGDGGAAANVSGYMTNVQGTSGSGFVAQVASGSESVSFCDFGALDASRVASAGGDRSYGSSAGAFCRIRCA